MSPQPAASKKELLTQTARQVFEAESHIILNGNWSNNNMRLAAANKAKAAFQAVTGTLDKLDQLVPKSNTQPLIGPYIDAFQTLVGVVLRKSRSSDVRLSVITEAGIRAESHWKEIQDSVDNAAPGSVDDLVREILGDLNDAIDAARALAKALPAGAIAGKRLIFDRKLRQLAGVLPPSVPGGPSVNDIAMSEISRSVIPAPPVETGGVAALGKKVLGRIKTFGTLAFGVTLALAVWDAIDTQTETTRSILQNAAGIALGVTLDKALETPIENVADAAIGAVNETLSQAAAPLFDGLAAGALIGETSTVAAMLPTGIGVVIGFAVSALVDLFFSIFWTDVTFPPGLVVVLTNPLTNDLHSRLTNNLTNSLTNPLTN